MYRLMPTNHLFFDGKTDHSDLFFKYRHKNETLGITTFKRKELFDRENNDNKVINYIKSFFNYGIHFDEMSDKYLLDPLQHPRLGMIAGYPVTNGLTKEYLDNGDFDSPLCCKWHPQANEWIVHPGRTRCRVLHFFLDSDLEVYAFNTQGLASPTYTHVFNNKKEITAYASQRINRPAAISLICSAYYGSLLPHISLEQNPDVVTDTFFKVCSFFRSTKINANFDLEMFDYCEKDILKTPQREVTVHINSHDDDTIIRAMLILPMHLNYEGYGVSIKTAL